MTLEEYVKERIAECVEERVEQRVEQRVAKRVEKARMEQHEGFIWIFMKNFGLTHEQAEKVLDPDAEINFDIEINRPRTNKMNRPKTKHKHRYKIIAYRNTGKFNQFYDLRNRCEICGNERPLPFKQNLAKDASGTLRWLCRLEDIKRVYPDVTVIDTII